MSKDSATRKLEAWLTERKLPRETIDSLIEHVGKERVFESAERIMNPDVWFHFPGSRRWVLIGSCPNGDAIALDTVREPGAVYFINHESVQSNISDDERTIKVADSLQDFLHACLDDPDFPFDYYEAKDRAKSAPGSGL
jgi:hypothetical protein